MHTPQTPHNDNAKKGRKRRKQLVPKKLVYGSIEINMAYSALNATKQQCAAAENNCSVIRTRMKSMVDKHKKLLTELPEIADTIFRLKHQLAKHAQRYTTKEEDIKKIHSIIEQLAAEQSGAYITLLNLKGVESCQKTSYEELLAGGEETDALL